MNPFRQKLVEDLLARMQSGHLPWRQGFSADKAAFLGGRPTNPSTGKAYRGGNSLLLMMAMSELGTDDPRFLTFKQARALDANVKKGSKAHRVEFWIWEDQFPDTPENRGRLEADGRRYKERGKTLVVRRKVPTARVYSVFHASQIEGDLPPVIKPEIQEIPPVERAEAVVKASGAKISHVMIHEFPCYQVGTDTIHMPPNASFEDAGRYYGTLLHELTHWTGHPSRINRTFGKRFGDESYAIEELVAEMGSAFLSAETGVPQASLESHAGYLQSWMAQLGKDPNLFFQAANAAEFATDFLLHRLTPEQEDHLRAGHVPFSGEEDVPEEAPDADKGNNALDEDQRRPEAASGTYETVAPVRKPRLHP
ncbi:MAG: ArdC family protein [Acidiferrobacteraceae bacterium]